MPIVMFQKICHRLFLASTAMIGLISLPAAGQVINENLKLTAFDRTAGDMFGGSIAIDNGIVAVGASNDGDNGTESGSVYLFEASTGKLLFKLLASDGAQGDRFGVSMDIDDGVIAIGAFDDDDNGNHSGSAYLFDSITGTELLKILPSDGSATDFFGNSIAIGNGVVAVGATFNDDNGFGSGSAYLFDTLTGEQLFKLLPSDGAESDQFGYSVAINDGVVAIGAVGDNDNGIGSGSVYLYDGVTGAQLFKLLPSDGAESDQFGVSVAIDNGVVAVGAVSDDDNGLNSGSAYLFDVSTGVQIAKLLAIDGEARDSFGSTIAIDNGIVAVGAHNDDDNSDASGSVYLFDASNGEQIAKLLPTDGSAEDHFGSSIAINNDTVAVGAPLDDGNGPDSGSAYVLDTSVVPCLADLSGDGELDFIDISSFIGAYTIQNPLADINSDGEFDFLDISAFLQSYSAGCP